MDEPTEFGARVGAVCGAGRWQEWVRDGQGHWRSKDGECVHDWDDLIDPEPVR